MSVTTLNGIESPMVRRASSSALTYSISPTMDAAHPVQHFEGAADIDSFLAQENPLGCVRGIMWVMAFNAAVFLFGFLVWQSFKLLW